MSDELTKSNLRRTPVILLPDFHQDRVIQQLRGPLLAAVNRILVSERRVVRDVDALGVMPRCELMLLQPRMTFHLVHGRRDGRVPEQSLHLSVGEIRDANRFHFTGFEELLHRFVCLGSPI